MFIRRYRQESTVNTGYRPKRTVSSLLYWMQRDMWRMFLKILYFLVRRFHWLSARDEKEEVDVTFSLFFRWSLLA